MSLLVLLLVLGFAPIAFNSQSTHAAINESLTFQGRLRTSSQAIVADGDYNLQFKIYEGGTESSGGTNTWTESYTATDQVRVENGYFNVRLGSLTSLSSVDFTNDTLWLTMNVGGTGGTPSYDGEMTPRIRLTATPYAFEASNSDTLDNIDSSQLARTDQNETFTQNLTIQGGTTTFGTASQTGALVLHDGTGQTTTLQAADSGVNLSFILPSAHGNDGQCLKTDGTGQFQFLNCNNGSGPGGSVTLQDVYDAGNTLTTTDARNIAFNLADTATDSDFVINIAGTGNLFEVRDGGSSVLTVSDGSTTTLSGVLEVDATLANQNALSFEGATADVNETTLAVADPTADRVITLPDADGDVCLTSGNCAGVGGTGDITGNGAANEVAYFTGSKNLTSSASLLFDGTDFNVDSNTLFVDGTNDRVGIGTPTPGFKLDVQDGTGIVAQFSGRVIGADAVNNNEFATLGQVDSISGSAGVTSLNSLDGALSLNGSVHIGVNSAGSNIDLSIQDNSLTATQLAAGSVDSSELVGGSVDESHLNATNAPTDNYVLTYDNASGGFSWIDPSTLGGGGSLFTDGGSYTYLTATADDLVLGGSTVAGSSLFFDESTANLHLGTDGSLDGQLTFYSSGGGTAANINTNAAGDLNLAAPSGTVVVGNGSGDIQLQLDNAADDFVASKSASLSGTYSSADFGFDRILSNASSGQTMGGSVLSVTDTSSAVAGTTINYDLILGNAAPTGSSFTGNLLRLQSGGTDQFVVSSDGTLATGTLALDSLTYTGDLDDAQINNTLTVGSTGSVADGALSANVSLLGQTIQGSEITDGTITNADIAADTIGATELATDAVGSDEIASDSVQEVDLFATNAATNEYILSYDSTSGGFTWLPQGNLDAGGVDTINGLINDVTIQGNAQIAATVSSQNINLSIQADSIGDTQLAFNTGQHLTTSSNVTFNRLTLGTGDDVLVFDGGDSLVSTHDGFGNFNFKSGVDSNNVITTTAGGSHIRLDESGAIYLNIDESTTVGGSFSSEAGITINNGAVSLTGNFNASNVNTGTLADARLSANVSLLGQTIEGSEITNGAIGDTQLAFNTGQHLTTTSSPTFGGLTVNGGASFSGTVSGADAVNNNEFVTLGQISGGATDAFVQDGNSFGALATLGTNDLNALAIETNGVEVARFDTDGNLGIGTSTPAYTLDVAGTTRTGGLYSIGDEFVDGDGSTTGGTGSQDAISENDPLVTVETADNLCADSLTSPANVFTDSGGNCDVDDADTHTVILGSLPAGDGTTTPDAVQVGSSWAFKDALGGGGTYDDGEDLYIDNAPQATYNSGRIGVGTASPQANLHVSSGPGTNGNSALLLEADTDNSLEASNPYIRLQQDGALVDGIFGQTGAVDTDPSGATYTDVNNNALLLGTVTTNSDLQLGAGGSVAATILSNGNVGFGTNSPDSPISLLASQAGGTTSVGITQNLYGSGATMELTTQDSAGSQAPRIVLRGGSNDADIEFLYGARGSSSKSMHIEGSSGNVGINTASPNYKLDVNGDVRVQGNNLVFGGGESILGGSTLRLSSDSAYIDIRPTSTSHGIILRDHTGGSTSWGGIRATAAGEMQMRADGSTYGQLHLDDSGRVGVGVTSPAQKLDVNGSGRFRAGAHQLRIYDTNTNNEEWTITTYSNNGLAFYEDGSSNRLLIDQGGNVGIGTGNPGHKLQVAGNITANNHVHAGTYLFWQGTATTSSTLCYTNVSSFGGSQQVRACASLRSLKHDIKNLDIGGLNTIRQLKPRQYKWNEDNRADLGFIAEEVEAINPLLAEYSGDGKLQSVKYRHLTALLTQGMQQLDSIVSSQGSRITALENQAGTYLQNGDNGQFASLNVSSNTTLNGALTVKENATFNKDVLVKGKLVVKEVEVRSNLYVNGEVLAATYSSKGELPKIEPRLSLGIETAEGVSPTAEIEGNDAAGTIHFTATQSPAPGAAVEVSFTRAYGDLPRIVLQPLNEASSELDFFIERTREGFVLKATSPIEDGATYSFDYQVISARTVSSQ